MTATKVSLVDVYVLRGDGASMQCLVLRRAPNAVRPGSWETVHGRIDAEEAPSDAGLRELHEETGLTPLRFYNLSRVDAFYLHRNDEIALIPAFVAFVAADARGRLTWPRERRAVEDAIALLGSGTAGPVEDVLRIC